MPTKPKTATRRNGREAADEPWISNYPPLDAWLKKHDARCMWQIPYGDPERPQAYVECWRVGRGSVVVVVRADNHGWDIYSNLNTNSVAESLDDAARRCELPPEVEAPASDAG